MKAKHFLFLLVSFCILITGCEKQATSTEAIVEKAYSCIESQEERNTILDWKDSRVTEIDYSKEQSHKIWDIDTNKEVDLKDKHVYRVVFRVKDKMVHGDISVYVDKRTNKVLGVDLRE